MDLAQKKEIEETLRMWRSAAYQEALKGKSERSVAAFLKMKGIPAELANSAGAEIFQEALAQHNRDIKPHRMVGWGMLLGGVLMLACLFIQLKAVAGGGIAFICFGLWWLWKHQYRKA
ncbi:MAG: hypothetical protein AAF226_00930 [Verrucomicrobiota bacterium]